MQESEIQYDLVVKTPTREFAIELGREGGWLERHRADLDAAVQLTLRPRSEGLPTVSARVEGHRWIYFSRVYGQVGSAKRVRIYALGWQGTVGGENVKSILWVYPNGVVELAEEPSFVSLYLSA